MLLTTQYIIKIKRFSGFMICALLPIMTYGAQFMVIECFADPADNAYFSDPVTGKPKKANSCGEALAAVPPHYFFLSSAGAGGGQAYTYGGVKFLFSDTPARKE
ncbi:MAG: hypothetical protein LEGION0403_FIIPPAGN_02861 [Legionella sp.]|uniref:hypothetical protein n=1 Tax=Legionella sp. TaxID=459 RepID=UPI003D0B750F